MKTVKTLLLGTAAAFAAFTGAQAADLPMAEPVEYVKVCSTYGEGFFYIPGTDTCLQISGYVRFDMYGDLNGSDFAGASADNDFSTNARGTIGVDARSETEWGTVRSYIEYEANFGSGTDGVSYSGGDSEIHAEAAFIQFAGITAGKASSFFDFVNAATYSDFFSAETVNQIAYTASFGSGFAATIAIEDKYFRAFPLNATAFTINAAGVVTDFTNAGLDQTWPNVVAALRVDQAWGSAQISGAIQDNEGDISSPDDEIGWAVQAGVKLNAGFLREGSYIWAQGAYSEGAISYAGAEDVYGNGLDIAFGGIFTGISDTNVFGEANTMWQAGGGVTFQASKTVALTGAATYSEYDDGFADGSFSYIHAEGNVFWTPVKNLDLGLGVVYGNAEFDNGDEVDDVRLFSRVQRSF
jgi:hypothetical protein